MADAPKSNHDTNVQRASKLDTTSLSDAMDRLGIAGQCLGIKPLDPRFRLTGRAFTILYGPAGNPPGTVGDYIDDVPVGGVVVLDNGGRENATVWGDILTWVSNRRGIAGTVIDGACRDTHLSRELGYPIYSRSYSMRTGKDRIQVEAMGGPVNIGDARVNQGDILRGDADGVVAIPREH
jgi:4-hydroxy-4-methyl-2-oxoglutarate aldolase